MLADLRPKAILFDFYGTLVDIETDEYDENAWDVVSHFLRYRGSCTSSETIHERYIHYVNEALQGSSETYPDVDVVPIFRRVMDEAGVRDDNGLATTVAQLFRSRTVKNLAPFPDAHATLEELSKKFSLALVTDSQEPYILAELGQTGLDHFFRTVVISSRYGYRKPDPRLMQTALELLGIAAADAVYVGDSWARDVEGAKAVGMDAIWVRREKSAARAVDEPHVHSIHHLAELKDLQPPG